MSRACVMLGTRGPPVLLRLMAVPTVPVKTRDFALACQKGNTAAHARRGFWAQTATSKVPAPTTCAGPTVLLVSMGNKPSAKISAIKSLLRVGLMRIAWQVTLASISPFYLQPKPARRKSTNVLEREHFEGVACLMLLHLASSRNAGVHLHSIFLAHALQITMAICATIKSRK